MIIYRIFNLKNNKSYIGQTIHTFEKRYKNSWWNRTHNEILKNSIEKQGLENFDFEILEKDISSLEELNRLEIFYAQRFNSYRPNGYNIRGCGDNKFVDEQQKELLSSFRIGTDYKLVNKKSSTYKGVYWRSSKKSWQCRFDNKKIKKIKYCSSEIEAAETFDKISLLIIGENSHLNFEDKRDEYLSSDLESFYQNFLKFKKKRKDGYLKDQTELRDKIISIIENPIKDIAKELNVTESKIRWCIKKYQIK